MGDPGEEEGARGPGTAGVRLHVVTGKGGTGKTTVAAALALALAGRRRRVLLVEVEGRQGIAALFGTGPLPYEERLLTRSDAGGELRALAIDPEESLLEYLEMFFRLGRARGALKRIGAVDFATTVAPGLRDVLLTGKAYEALRRTEAGRAAYDAVVMDAPPTGRITRFLGVNGEVAGLVRAGLVADQAGAIAAVLRSPGTAVHVVTLLEEMPVQETRDAVAELRAAGLPVGAVVANLVIPPVLAPAELAAAAAGALDRSAVAAGLGAAGLPEPAALADGLLGEAAGHARRVALEGERRAELAALGRPVLDLELLPDGVDLDGLHALAGRLDGLAAA